MLITNGQVVTWENPNRILADHAIYIENDRIKEIGPTRELVTRHPDPAPLDARGQYILPGNICAHTHFYGAFARGLAINPPAPKNFLEILTKLWWKLDRALSPEDIRCSALVCLIDAIKHGTTTLFDHHASPNFIDGSLDIIADAVVEAGTRAVLCYEVTDRNGIDQAYQGVKENLRFIKKQKSAHSMKQLAAAFGLHASFTLSDNTLDKCSSSTPNDIGFHIHAAESDTDQYECIKKYNMRVIKRLQHHGILKSSSLLAHAVRVDESEMDLLSKSHAWVTHQPRSNMNNGVGVAPIGALLEHGIKVGLGNDGFSNAMWEEWKTYYLIHKAWNHDPSKANGNEVVDIAIYNNAALAHVYFPDTTIGTLVPGAYADIIFVDYHPYTSMIPENTPWHIIFGFRESMVTTTIVGGKLLMKDRVLQTLDEGKISFAAQRLSSQVWKRFQEM
jgi:putative selenium metabolism protein SsnA